MAPVYIIEMSRGEQAMSIVQTGAEAELVRNASWRMIANCLDESIGVIRFFSLRPQRDRRVNSLLI